MASKLVQNAIAVVREEASTICKQKMVGNVWAYNSREAPNADRLVHGAIQRQSVSVGMPRAMYTHMNPDRIGVYKRPELNTKAYMAT